MIRRFTPFILACAGALGALAPASARAQTPAETPSNDHAKRARVAYDLQDWPTAVQEYRAAYQAEQKAEYLFGLAQALRQNHEYAAAIGAFKAYKRIDGVSPQQATAAELLITKCEAEQARADADATLRQSSAAPAAPAAPADSAPPAAPAPAAPVAAPPAAPPAPPKAFYEDVLGDSLFVLGVGSAGVGTLLLLSGNSAMSASASKPTEAAAHDAADSARTKQVTGGVLLPVGGLLLAGAAWRWLSVGSGRAPATTGLMVGPTYAEYSGRF